MVMPLIFAPARGARSALTADQRLPRSGAVADLGPTGPTTVYCQATHGASARPDGPARPGGHHA